MISFSGQSCKTRWGNIRDNFRKSLRKNTTVSGQKAKSGKLYKYAEQLSFLKEFFNTRETRSNIGDEVRNQDLSGDDEENDNTDNNETQQLSTQVDSPANEQSHCHTLSTPTQTGSLRYSTPSKKLKLSLQKKNPPKTAAATVMEYLLKEQESMGSPSIQSPDPVDAFLSGIAPALKKLPPRYWLR